MKRRRDRVLTLREILDVIVHELAGGVKAAASSARRRFLGPLA